MKRIHVDILKKDENKDDGPEIPESCGARKTIYESERTYLDIIAQVPFDYSKDFNIEFSPNGEYFAIYKANELQVY